MKTLIVGFGYKARSGKDTLAQAVQARLPEAKTFSLAGDLKAIARGLGMVEKNPRALQLLGEAGREINPNVWINRVVCQIREARPRVALVPDVRYLNEAKWIASEGGILIRVDRIMPDGERYVSDDRPATHVSETELDGKAWFDRYYQIGDGDMEGFDKAADEVLALIRERTERPATPVNPRQILRDAIDRGVDRAIDLADTNVAVADAVLEEVEKVLRLDPIAA